MMVLYFLKWVTKLLAVSSVILISVGLEETGILIIAFAVTFGISIVIVDVAPDDSWANRNKDVYDED